MLAPRLFGWDEPAADKVNKFSAYCTKKLSKELAAYSVPNTKHQPQIKALFPEEDHTGTFRQCQGSIGSNLFRFRILENNCGILLLHDFAYVQSRIGTSKFHLINGLIKILNRAASATGRFGCLLATTNEEQKQINKILRANGFKSKSHYNQNSGNKIYVWQLSLKRKRPLNLT